MNDMNTETHTILLEGDLTIAANTQVIIVDSGIVPEANITVEQNAQVDIVAVYSDRTAEDAISIKRVTTLDADATVRWHSALTGNKTHVEVINEHHGNGSSSEHNGVFIGQERDRYAMRYFSKHIGKHTSSNIVVNGVLLDRAYADFVGNVIIAESAVDTEGHLDEHTLLLGERSRSDAIPQLEIDTNEVVASHSSSITKIDDEQLFYLLSRGIPETEARYMIVRGFVEGIIDGMPHQETKDGLFAYIEDLLFAAVARDA